MEKIYVSGDIHLNNVLSLEAAYNIYKKLKKDTRLDSWAGCILDAVDDDCIIIPKTSDIPFYSYVDIFLAALDDNGYIAKGELDCVDSDEDFRGICVIENNGWEYYDKEDIWKIRVSVSELKEVLEKRGYKIYLDDTTKEVG